MQHDSAFSPTALPCGRYLPNRLVKVALYEHLADFHGGPPNKHHLALYEAWSKGTQGYGMVLTGNVQVSREHLTLGRDMVIPSHISDVTIEPFKRLSNVIHSNGTSLAIMQLSHTGRQSSNIITGTLSRPLAPSAIRLGNETSGALAKFFYWLLFRTPKAMVPGDIYHVVDRFVLGAQVSLQSGFDGIQLHAAHGCRFNLISTNRRTDEFAAQEGNELNMLRILVSRIRAVVPATFVIGIKLNAGDYSASVDDPSISPKEQRALNHITTIAGWGGVDFIEISGGDYESPDFMSTRPKSSRQAFFSHVSQKAVQTLESMPRKVDSPPLPLILLTGGLRTPAALHSALKSNHAHLLGIGRSAILCPDIPSRLASSSSNDTTPFAPEPDIAPPPGLPAIPLVGAGANMSWYGMHMRGLEERPNLAVAYPDYSLTGPSAVLWTWIWLSEPYTYAGLFRLLLWPCLAAAAILYAF
ncbi:hypothetical protein DFP72DRAFT_998505 [Ephemerocybe angulata]|uniref:NADH:flavin oxidoreductase/NADH oxidase N-terminal domain-containing protein n=1 Tax=Ephemerocybe angulata TaxID=980116 RepID=A0A8H6MFY6_9AGAR|nr:hypothetical protein DFP72DRAFT_998505 [Tulosesus angulatus]